MSSLFSASQIDKINAVAAKSKEVLNKPKAVKVTSNSTLEAMSQAVIEYFKDSPAILITTEEELSDYVDKCIEAGYAGIDTETTGLDRINDHIVGFSLYYPGGVEAYIPCKHMVPIFDTPRNNQLSYETCGRQVLRLVTNKVKLILANADFDIAMIYKDFKVDIIPAVYYDVILAWRVLKENEPHNQLKVLYNKYVLKGKGDPKQFTDFFDVKLFPYCKPEIAKLYAANDAKITYELYKWQLPFVTKTHPLCKKHHLEQLADIVWSIEIPMIKPCAWMNRHGVYFDSNSSEKIKIRYQLEYAKELEVMRNMVQKLIDEKDTPHNPKRPFKTAATFNPNGPKDTQYMLYDLLQLPIPQSGKNKGKKVTSKEAIQEINLPETNQLLKVRSLSTLIGTFTEKLPNAMAPDHRIHARFNSIGAATGRMSSADPNLQNIPSHHKDIRHNFRATPSLNKVYSCKYDENKNLTALIDSLDKVDTTNGKCYVKDLKSSDKVKALANTDEIDLIVDDVKVNNNNTTLITFSSITLDESIKYTVQTRTPSNVIIGSDYSQQEPKLTAFVSNDPNMIKAFQEDKDIYATIAGLAFRVPYENCLESHPETHDYQPDGEKRRGSAKTIVLGILYGRSVNTIGEQLFGKNKDMSDEEKTKEAQKIYDAVLNAFPNLRSFMITSQGNARKYGYVETILGRRRHIPDMQLPRFEFEPLPGYINPDIDPLDPSTLANKDKIPQRIVDQLSKEYASFKYRGQIYKKNQELYEQHIKVHSNEKKIEDASRECVNSRIQGSAAELTKMAILRLVNSHDYARLGCKLLVPVHDELLIEAPQENAEEAGKLLSDCMCEAGGFLPFKISCDVVYSHRWYGLSYPCPYTKPTDINTNEEDEVKWIQYHLFEMEYMLPIYKDENGEKLRGDAAKGVNGRISDEMLAAIADYKAKWRVSDDNFIEDIENRVNGTIDIYECQDYQNR